MSEVCSITRGYSRPSEPRLGHGHHYLAFLFLYFRCGFVSISAYVTFQVVWTLNGARVVWFSRAVLAYISPFSFFFSIFFFLGNWHGSGKYALIKAISTEKKNQVIKKDYKIIILILYNIDNILRFFLIYQDSRRNLGILSVIWDHNSSLWAVDMT